MTDAEITAAARSDPDNPPLSKRELALLAKLRRGGRPPSDNPKRQVTLRLDADVIEHFAAGGPGWQTRINTALRRAAKLPSAQS
jgi:uncharacterized protein (DUF4415 family)